MKFRLIRPSAPDFLNQLDQIKPAYAASDNPEAEFADVKASVCAKEASYYMLTGKGVRLWFIGQVQDGNYHIIAMTGAGLVEAASHIIDRVSSCGYEVITYHTYRKGMRRILGKFGFEQVEQLRAFNSTTETVHQLIIEGGSNGRLFKGKQCQ
ncbi:hypothetical protein [Photobacterium satsumensis]|uniref:hypothetical protein n=1 Tax=Photobacterium satsumensis TaxID=2910239 RepID=UPI003D0B6AD0